MNLSSTLPFGSLGEKNVQENSYIFLCSGASYSWRLEVSSAPPNVIQSMDCGGLVIWALVIFQDIIKKRNSFSLSLLIKESL